jgi:hypothetical protein
LKNFLMNRKNALMEITPEIRDALADVKRVYNRKIADAFKIGILNDWLSVVIEDDVLIWEGIGPGAMIFDEIEKGSNKIVMKRTK